MQKGIGFDTKRICDKSRVDRSAHPGTKKIVDNYLTRNRLREVTHLILGAHLEGALLDSDKYSFQKQRNNQDDDFSQIQIQIRIQILIQE